MDSSVITLDTTIRALSYLQTCSSRHDLNVDDCKELDSAFEVPMIVDTI